MAREAGNTPFIHYREMAYMGFSEVLRHLPQVLSNLRRAKERLKAERPDALILVDYPSFNLKLARYAHDMGVKVYYYISPKVWAWKEHRVRDIKRYVDRVFAIFPLKSASTSRATTTMSPTWAIRRSRRWLTARPTFRHARSSLNATTCPTVP